VSYGAIEHYAHQVVSLCAQPHCDAVSLYARPHVVWCHCMLGLTLCGVTVCSASRCVVSLYVRCYCMCRFTVCAVSLYVRCYCMCRFTVYAVSLYVPFHCMCRCHCMCGVTVCAVSLVWWQDDRLYPLLTVRETLEFSARLRLPGSLPWPQKRARVEDLLTQLGLEAWLAPELEMRV